MRFDLYFHLVKGNNMYVQQLDIIRRAQNYFKLIFNLEIIYMRLSTN